MAMFTVYFASPSTRLSLCIAAVMYLSYAVAHGAWSNPALIGVTGFIACFMPLYSRFSNGIESRARQATVSVTGGRVGRFVPQFAFNFAALGLVALGGALIPGRIEAVGGVLGAALITTLASQGAQYVAIMFYNRGYGDLNRNVLLGLSANIVMTALATAGVPVAREIFLFGGIAIGAVVFAAGLLSDGRALLAPKGGVAILLGTFNPFHLTHMDLVRRVLAERGLDKVVIHPTIVPRLHATALARGEIRIARVEGGIQVMERTEKADANVDYFPTGNRFLAPETRRVLIEAAVAEAGLGDRVEVAFWPELYAKKGFHGVVAAIRKANPGARLHGLHGNDVGGMAVRAILDECGWIYPFAVRRRDDVSATAIRKGAEGMTSPVVTAAFEALRGERAEVTILGRKYRNDDGVLRLA